ncbi:histone-lysine N-methyltransferase ASHR1 isoform X2 [Andrographis paniculata]|uniref:histone-lysine N-methyltransferase ASHR1 isoform X2 n=1 Tax=Andrographis paniculata TaxID=175694 RepID=UPI0021E7A0BE|nr:histone-lysine N-methyltransferase ASHR1 isoform X2 [Andrographis paniculata]
MDEPLKALSDKDLSISTLQEKGRCLVTTRDFSPGEVILRETPYVSVPTKNKESPKSKCEWCFTSRNLKRCSACHLVWYCSSKCQKADWKFHSVECEILPSHEKNRITPSIRLMVRLYMRRKLEISKIMPTTAMEDYKFVDAMVSHYSDIGEEKLVLYAQMANLVSLILLRWPVSNLDIKGIAETFSKLACNAHTICDSELRPLGTGLFPFISLINHSCLPNAVLVFEGRSAVVRAIQHIPEGSEVLISYIDIAGSTITRKKALKEQYYFDCGCIRCLKLGEPEDMQESAMLEGYRCKNEKCDGVTLRDSDNKGFVCQKCGLSRDMEEIKNIAKEIELRSEKTSELLYSGRNLEAIASYMVFEDLQVQLCHPFSINLMRTRETLLRMFMEKQDWEQALEYCRLTIPVYEKAYPSCHPLLGLQYYMCGKLEWAMLDAEGAARSLTKALDVLRITHGARSGFVMELHAQLEEARAEASYNTHQHHQD